MSASGYHFHGKVISRSEGKSAVAAVAYRTGDKLKDERTGEVKDYSRKCGVLFVWHAVPKDAPEWAKDIEQAWNMKERAEDRSTCPNTAQLARDYDMAFPHQLSAEQREWMLKDFVREEFTRKNLLATAAIHEPPAHGDERNYHAHIMVCDRTIDANGFNRVKERHWTTKAEQLAYEAAALEKMREKWAELGARQLARAGYPLEAERWRHGHKTLEEQREIALARGDLKFAKACEREEKSKHLGPSAAAMERRGVKTERGAALAAAIENSEIKIDLKKARADLTEVQRDIAHETARAFDRNGPRVTGRFAARDDDHQKKQQDAEREKAEREARQQAEKARAAESIREAWTASDGSGLSFMIELQDRGLQVARDPASGRFCAVAENGFVHGFSQTAHGEQGRAMQQALTAMQRDYAALILPTVDECRKDMATRREAEREAKREAWKERETALSSDLNDVQAAIRLAYRLAPDGKAFAEMLEHKGLTLAEVGRVNAWASKNAHEMALLDKSRPDAPPILKEGEFVVLNQYGNLYRLNQRTTGDGQTEIHAKLATLDRREVLSLDDARAVMRDVQTQREKERELKSVQQRNERHAMAYPKPAFRPPWAAPLQKQRTSRDETPRPLHPDDHAQRIQERDRLDPNRYLADSDYRREVWRQEAAKKEAQRDEREQAREEKRDRTEQTEQQQIRAAREALREWKERQPLWSRARGYDDDDDGRERER